MKQIPRGAAVPRSRSVPGTRQGAALPFLPDTVQLCRGLALGGVAAVTRRPWKPRPLPGAGTGGAESPGPNSWGEMRPSSGPEQTWGWGGLLGPGPPNTAAFGLRQNPRSRGSTSLTPASRSARIRLLPHGGSRRAEDKPRTSHCWNLLTFAGLLKNAAAAGGSPAAEPGGHPRPAVTQTAAVQLWPRPMLARSRL